MKGLKKVITLVTKVELSISAVTFAVMVICYFISTVNRNIIKGSMPWTEELALYGMVFMVLLGTEVGLRDGTQVSVTALTDKLKGKKAGKILDYIASVVLIVFVAMILWFGISMVTKQMQTGQTSPIMKIPMYLLYLSLPVSFGLTLITQILILVGKIFNIPMDEVTAVDSTIDSFVKGKED